MARAIHYNIETRMNDTLERAINNDPKILLMLRISDTIISQSDIDHLLFELLCCFMKYEQLDDSKDLLEKALKFEHKRALLGKILNKYSLDSDTGVLATLKSLNIDLRRFIADLQATENPRNNLAHKDTLIEILKAKHKKELEDTKSNLLNDEKYCELTGIDRIGEIVDIDNIYHRYNEILEPYNFLIDFLEQGGAEELVGEIISNNKKRGEDE